jgi:hypothetical protein
MPTYAGEVHVLEGGGHPPLTFQAGGTVTGGRFVTITGSETGYGTLVTTTTGGNITGVHSTAAARTSGVARYDVASGAKGGLIRGGNIVQVTASAAITKGDEVEVATGGKSVTLASGVAVGRAITTGSTDALHYVLIY